VWLSRAVHTPEAPAGDVDALVLAPIAEARKTNPALGFEALRLARQAHEKGPQRPLIYALGGITHENAAQALEAGADGVAVMGALFADAPLDALLAKLRILR
jgi:thiamine monophosphate synthase